jgi:parallel beta-helix repeat protein
MLKVTSGTIIILLLFSAFPLASIIQPVKAAAETIYIMADGSVDPPDAPILNVGNVSYTFTDNINDSLVVERDNIVVDGAGHTLEGNGSGIGIYLTFRGNVTITNITIRNFYYGICFFGSSNNILYANRIANNARGIRFASGSTNNSIFANSITNNDRGIYFGSSPNNSISANTITNNSYGFYLMYSSDNNSVSANTIANNVNGIYLEYASNGNSISANNVTNNNGYGILLEYSSNNNSISANSITDNKAYGIYLGSSSNGNSITGNNITKNARHGIELWSSGNNISANNITNNDYGIGLISSSGNTLTANNVTESSNYGIYLYSSANNTVSANSLANNWCGLCFSNSSNNTLSGNNVTSNSYYGLYFDYSPNNTVSGNTVTDNWKFGLCFYFSGGNVLRNNLMTGNLGNSYFAGYNLSDFLNDIDTTNTVNSKPIYYWVNRTSQTIPADAGCVVLVNCTQITVQDLNLLNNGQGILLAYTSASTIRRNNLTSGINGLDMYFSTGNTVSANSLAENSNYGLYFSSSANNTVSENNVTNSGYGVLLSASSSNSIFANTITGSSTYDGIRLVSSSDNNVSANTIANNEYGILLVSSSSSTISANNMTNNFHGIHLYDSSDNSISANTITNNKIGIYPYHSSGNSIFANTIANNELGISLISSNNLIWHNNFVDNTAQVYVEPGYVNVWDDGYPSGGNLWVDYIGVDFYSGPYQNVTGSDGIGDTAYVINANNIDHYPFQVFTLESVTSWYWTNNTVVNSVAVGDVDGDSQKETVTGGTFYDGVRDVAQLVVWNSSSLAPEQLTAWYWFDNTTITSVAMGDVDGDGGVEIVTGGYYFDGTRRFAQLVVWNGSSLAVEGVTTWYWVNNTIINSVALGDVDGDTQVEIVTGGYFNDDTRNIAQLVVWNGTDLSVDRLTTWYWTNNTVINSVAIGDVDADNQTEIVTGGTFNDGTRDNAQLVVWNGFDLSVDRLTSWYWTADTAINSVALGDVDAEGQTEIVTGGHFNDGTRGNAQLVVWNGFDLAVDRLTSWYWTENTAINSVSLGDVDGGGRAEIVTGGYFNDGKRNVAQLVDWSGSNLAVENIRTWYWVNDTTINSVCISDFSSDFTAEIVAGGAYNDGSRWVAQSTVWSMKQSV